MGRSAQDDRELPGRDVAADDQEALETTAIRRDGPPDEVGKKPTKGRGGTPDAG